jgi:hypothetical protein
MPWKSKGIRWWRLVNDGDIVILQPAQDANNGEMVAVWLTDEDETILKRFYREDNCNCLQHTNPKAKRPYRSAGKPAACQPQNGAHLYFRQVVDENPGQGTTRHYTYQKSVELEGIEVTDAAV